MSWFVRSSALKTRRLTISGRRIPRPIRLQARPRPRPPSRALVDFVLHGPRGARHAIIPSVRDPDRLFAIAPRGLFSYRPTPFGGVWSAVEDGKLVIAGPDAWDADWLPTPRTRRGRGLPTSYSPP